MSQGSRRCRGICSIKVANSAKNVPKLEKLVSQVYCPKFQLLKWGWGTKDGTRENDQRTKIRSQRTKSVLS